MPIDREGDAPFGAHVMKDDRSRDQRDESHDWEHESFLSIERRARHALKSETFSLGGDGAGTSAETDPPTRFAAGAGAKDGSAAPADGTGPTTENDAPRTRRRRQALIPIAAAVGAIAVGLGGGGAFAYFSAAGSGAGEARGGEPITASVVATTGPADLLPGGTGAVYFTLQNNSPSGGTFDVVETGATVHSSNVALCGDSNVSIAQSLPYLFAPPVTVSADGTSGPQSIPGLVALSPSAPSTCQGLTFTVTLTLTGKST